MLRTLLVLASCCVAAVTQQEQRPPLWSDRPIARPTPPEVADASWCRSPLDRFVLAAMVQNGVSPAAAATRAEWLRRASLDLCGLPPSPEQVAAFERDDREDAYEREVDRLLQDQAFGERWAQWWLDLARYADSQGYEKDGLRPHMWRYRDWVIEAFARDLPFDQFTVLQLAGDLLPEATVEQRVATAMHRNTMTNTEGGTDNEEFRSAAVVDRTNTTMSVWMGATAGCAQCHDHKYDAISQKEYFQLYAFFDQTEDQDRDDEEPVLRAPTEAQAPRVRELDAKIADLERELAALPREAWVEAVKAQLAAFAAARPRLSPWKLLGPVRAESFEAAIARKIEHQDLVRADAVFDGQQWQERADFVDGRVHEWRGDNASFFLLRTIDCVSPTRAVLALGSDDAIDVWINGVNQMAHNTSRAAAPRQELVEVDLPAGRTEILLRIINGSGPGGFCFELAATTIPPAGELALEKPVSERTASERAMIDAAFAVGSLVAAMLTANLAGLRAELDKLGVPLVAVLKELPPDRRRTTRIHLRGSFLSLGEPVAPAVPACWPALPPTATADRLALAKWLCSRDNPRTARVLVSRAWEQLFGRGLVASTEDFGVQGDRPSHPELLDWLACEVQDRGWSWKALLRGLVLSSTYRQGGAATGDGRERDPQNRWFARSPRLRLSAEMLRDQALSTAGLLSRGVFGPSVMPEQPDGVWGQIYSGDKWRTSDGDDRHRRSLYTLWRRTSPHPTMTTFDAPSREFCVVRRIPTNTPMQALALWNDPQFVECRDALAARVLVEAEASDEARIAWLVRRCLLREPGEQEMSRLLQFLGDERRMLDGATAEVVAFRRLVGVVMGLDEFVTH